MSLVKGGNSLRPPVTTEFCPNWRWETVLQLSNEYYLEIPRRIREADPWIARSFIYYRRYEGARADSAELRRLSMDYPTLHEAHSVFSLSDAKTTRWILEAFICSGSTPEEIAEAYPISPEVTSEYEKGFFDIRWLLKYRSFVLTNILSPSLLSFPGDQDLQWKMIAYLGGLDRFVKFLDISSSFNMEEWGWFCRLIRNAMMRNALNAALQIRPTSENEVDLQDLHMRFEQGMRLHEVGRPSDPMQEYISGTMNAVGSLLGSNAGLLDEFNKVIPSKREPRIAESISKTLAHYVEGV